VYGVQAAEALQPAADIAVRIASAWLASCLLLTACAGGTGANGTGHDARVPGERRHQDGRMDDDALTRARQAMVESQVRARGVTDVRVLDAMATVPRHEFVSAEVADEAYTDSPLPIGYGQTISQPYIVALMTQLARPEPDHVALEVGTGSGYQAAILSPLVRHVYTIELVPELADVAARRLARYANVTPRQGDGYQGWPEHGPFDIIVVTAAPEEVPPALREQLKVGGRLVIPVGPVGATQELRVIVRQADGTYTDRNVTAVRFVPLQRAR